MTKDLLKLLQQHTSQLVEVSKHRTDNTVNRLIVVINGIRYSVVCRTLTSKLIITIGMIPKLFKSGVPVCVELRSELLNKKKCLICFDQIPEIPRQFSEFYRIPQLNFSVCVFEENLIRLFPAKNSDDYSHQSIALGYFNVMSFIEQFRRISSNEWRIQVLWRMFDQFLCEIGYFDFFNYNHFMSMVFTIFQRMFRLNEKILPVRIDVLKELFFSFIRRLLMNNSWFLICEKLILPVRSSALINLFSDQQNPPIVNFIDCDSGFVGVSTFCGVGNDFKLNFLLVSLETTEVIYVEDEDRTWYPDNGSQDNENIDDFDDGSPLKRMPAFSKPECIKEGIIPFGNHQHLFVFISGTSMNIFIRHPDGTFGHFNIYLFVLLHSLNTDESLHELTFQFTHFPYVGSSNLREGLEQCGVRQILEGTASLEDILNFFYRSHLGVVLEELRKNFQGFQERLRAHYLMKYQEEEFIQYHINSQIYSIQANRFINDFMSFLTPVLQKLEEIRVLTPEIIEILQFLKELFAFFTPTAPPDMSD